MWNYAENRSIASRPIARVDLNIRDATKVEKRPFCRGSMLERAAANNGKCMANGAACDRGYRIDVICAHLCGCMRLRDRVESHGGYSLYCIRNRESFAGEEWRKTGGPRHDICEALYCPDKANAVLLAYQRSSSPVQHEYLPICSLYPVRLLDEKSETCPRKDRTCGTITHLEEGGGGNKELWKDRRMIDTWAQGVHVLQVHFQEVIYNGCHGWLDFSANHTER